MDRLREEAKEFLKVSGYLGAVYLHQYLKPFKEMARKEGFTYDQIDLAIEEITCEFFAGREAWL